MASNEFSRSLSTRQSAVSSNSQEFIYAALVPNGERKPAIPVVLHSMDGRRSFPLYALPDSGADMSCFPEDWASPLGIDLAGCRKREVHTGAGIGVHHDSETPLQATIAGRTIGLRASFGPVLVALLGREDFFRHFRVEFDQRRKVTVLHPYA